MSNRFVTQFEFACEIFGYENAKSLNKNYIDMFYNDWKLTSYSLNQYKKLLSTRG